MSAIKWLNNLLFLESFLGVHRKYCSQKKMTKKFINFKIFLQTLFYSIVVSIKLYFLWGEDGVLDQVNIIYGAFSASAFINALSSVVTGIWYSRDFMSYYRSISRVSDWFKNDMKLIKSLKKMYWCTIIFVLFFVVFVISRSWEVKKKFPVLNEIIVALIFGLQTIVRLTLVYQQIILFVVIMIIVYLFKSLNSLLLAVQNRIGICDSSSEEQHIITRGQIEEWVELYRDLVNCCVKVTLCFGGQYFFSLIVSTPNYILMIYQIFYQIALKKKYTGELKKIIIAIICYLFVMLLPVVAGQLARNQGRKLHRVLARLYNSVIIIDSKEAELKLIKDFIRLIKKYPVEIKLSSKISAGMYILPVMFAVVINHVIVLLQFNHVI